MPLYNEILQGRQQNLLTKLFAMVGGSPAPQLAPEIQPGWNVDNWDSDTAVLQGVRWCYGCGIATAVAAQYPRVGIRNGAGVNFIPLSLVVVKSFSFWSSNAQGVLLQRIAPPAGAVSSERRHQDFRINVNDPLGIPPHDITAYSSPTAPASTATFGRYVAPANTLVGPIPCHLVLPPTTGGCYIELIGNLLNSDLVANFEYYYREITPAELTI